MWKANHMLHEALEQTIHLNLKWGDFDQKGQFEFKIQFTTNKLYLL